MSRALTTGPRVNPFFSIPAMQKTMTNKAQPIMPTRQLVHCLMSGRGKIVWIKPCDVKYQQFL